MNPSFDYTKTYYKITNKEENHNGFQFKDGLNEDVIPFSTEECTAGGIYFSDIQNILRYLTYNNIIGYYIREVTVPEDAEVSIEGNKYKASKIILGERKELNLYTIKCIIEQGGYNDTKYGVILQWASISSCIEVVEYLLECNKIDIPYKNHAFRWASRNGHLEIVKYLVEQGIDIHTQSADSLKWASGNGHLEVVKYLVEHGADIHANNEVALRWASINYQLEVVKYLVEQGANIYDDAPLHIAYSRIVTIS